MTVEHAIYEMLKAIYTSRFGHLSTSIFAHCPTTGERKLPTFKACVWNENDFKFLNK